MTLKFDHLTPPKADRKPHSFSHHGDTVEDVYHWLKDPSYPTVKDKDILGYLHAENAYFEATLGQHSDLIETIFEEIKSRIPDEDEGVPYKYGPFLYQWRFKEGAQYRSWYRKPANNPANNSADWTLFLDETKEADGESFYKLGDFELSGDGMTMAVSADTSGGERYDVSIHDLTGTLITKSFLKNRSPELVFSADGKHLYSVELSEEWRPFKVTCSALDTGETTVLYEEQDPSFFVHITPTSDHRYLVIRTADHVTAECHVVPLDDQCQAPILIEARQTGHDYSLDHNDNGFLILSDKIQKNFSLYRMAIIGDEWHALLEGHARLYIRGFQAFKDFTAIAVREDGLDGIWIQRQNQLLQLDFGEEVFEANLGNNAEFEQEHIRIGFTSLTTPPSVIDADAGSGVLRLKKRQEIPAGYDASQYTASRLMVPARDGALVPVSIVHHKDWQKGTHLHLYGYGAYGLGMSPAFSAARLSLLDRGFAYAIAHIRGGDEMGRAWYEAGKLKERDNCFHDFVDVTRYLQDEGYCAPKTTSISGGSAGGELMGAVLNEAKELYGAAILHVPFVDVLNTMLDESLPLTPIEWPEWGNPILSAEDYAHIKSYCPYTNMQSGEWPAMLVTGGLNDPRVTYWEPAKYVARLRTLKADNTPLLMKINMEAGHKGKSGRFERYKEVAEEYAFIQMVIQ